MKMLLQNFPIFNTEFLKKKINKKIFSFLTKNNPITVRPALTIRIMIGTR